MRGLIMLIKPFWTTVALVVFFCAIRSAKGQEINFCSLRVSPAVLQAHTDFNAVYAFDVDQKGLPVNVKAISRQFTDPADVQACLLKWHLPGAISKHLVAVFKWEHAKGWTSLSVSGPDVKLVIRLSGERCPYCPTHSPK